MRVEFRGSNGRSITTVGTPESGGFFLYSDVEKAWVFIDRTVVQKLRDFFEKESESDCNGDDGAMIRNETENSWQFIEPAQMTVLREFFAKEKENALNLNQED